MAVCCILPGKLTDEKMLDILMMIFISHILPNGKFSKAENIGPPLNTSDNNFVCFISHDNSRLYVANKYIKNTYNYAGLSVSNKQKDGTWSKPKLLIFPIYIIKMVCSLPHEFG